MGNLLSGVVDEVANLREWCVDEARSDLSKLNEVAGHCRVSQGGGRVNQSLIHRDDALSEVSGSDRIARFARTPERLLLGRRSKNAVEHRDLLPHPTDLATQKIGHTIVIDVAAYAALEAKLVIVLPGFQISLALRQYANEQQVLPEG